MIDDRRDLVRRIVRLGPFVGLIGLAVGGVCYFVSPDAVMQAYLVAFAFWWTLAVGGLALGSMHQTVSGRWGLITSRAFEAMARTMPLVGLMFVPILLQLGRIYPWVGTRELGNKGAWLNPAAFTGRALAYFVIWSLLAFVLGAWSGRRDTDPRPGQRNRLIKLGAGGLVLFVVTTTFASIDWFMSLEPDWASTIYGGLFVVDAGLLALSLGIVVAWLRFDDEEPASEYATPEAWNDLGNLLLAFTMIWGYFQFSQFLIIWSADLPVETVWYFERIEGGWLFWANANVVLHFVVPFLLLLSRDVKRDPNRLAAVAAFTFVAHFVHDFWMIAPAFGPGRWAVWLLAWPLWIGLGGLWIGYFGRQLARRPILPENDPAAERHRQRAAHGNGHSPENGSHVEAPA